MSTAVPFPPAPPGCAVTVCRLFQQPSEVLDLSEEGTPISLSVNVLKAEIGPLQQTPQGPCPLLSARGACWAACPQPGAASGTKRLLPASALWPHARLRGLRTPMSEHS